VPKELEGMAYVQQQGGRMLKSVAEEIDMMFVQFGLADKVPKPFRYAIMVCLTLLPVILLCCFFMCLPDDDIEPPKENKKRVFGNKDKDAKVAEDSGEQAKSPPKKKNKIE